MNKLILSVFIGVMFQTNLFAIDTEKTATVLQIMIPSIAYGTTRYFDDEEGQIQFYKSFGANIGVTYGLKYTVDKKRPNGEKYSFPSGHTSMAFQGASFIHKRYGLKYALPAYIAATFVGYNRVESDAHYIEDVIAGAAIGTLSSFYFTTPYKEFELKFVAIDGGYGIALKRTW